MAARSALVDRIFELLADGQWHDLELVLIDLARLVPPGKAARKQEYDRAVQKTRGNTAPTTRVVPRDPQYLVQRGARRLAYEALKGLQVRGKLQLARNESGDRRVRLTPPD